MDECNWTTCDAPARLDVLAGPTLSAAELVGAYCLPHASLTSRDVQAQRGATAWYDWHRPKSTTRPLAGFSLGFLDS